MITKSDVIGFAFWFFFYPTLGLVVGYGIGRLHAWTKATGTFIEHLADVVYLREQNEQLMRALRKLEKHNDTLAEQITNLVAKVKKRVDIILAMERFIGRLRKALRVHWLSQIECNHADKTDVAICACSHWRSEPQPSVGDAVEQHRVHVFSVAEHDMQPAE